MRADEMKGGKKGVQREVWKVGGAGKAKQRAGEGQGLEEDGWKARQKERCARTSPGRRSQQQCSDLTLVSSNTVTDAIMQRKARRGLGCSSSAGVDAPPGAPLRCVRNSQGRGNVSRAGEQRGDGQARSRVQSSAAAEPTDSDASSRSR
jgi:hypothetical protein